EARRRGLRQDLVRRDSVRQVDVDERVPAAAGEMTGKEAGEVGVAVLPPLDELREAAAQACGERGAGHAKRDGRAGDGGLAGKLPHGWHLPGRRSAHWNEKWGGKLPTGRT